MEIRSFKMRTGEEITCSIEQRNGDTGEIKISNPVMIMNMPNPRAGQQNPDGSIEPPQTTQMVGWFQTSCGTEREGSETTNRKFTLSSDMYFVEGEPMTYIKESYNQQFGAGILIPDQAIVSAG